MKTDNELETLVIQLVTELTKKDNWVEVKRPVLARLDYNIYAYLDYGKRLSDGTKELRIGTVLVKYNGEVSYSNHL